MKGSPKPFRVGSPGPDRVADQPKCSVRGALAGEEIEHCAFDVGTRWIGRADVSTRDGAGPMDDQTWLVRDLAFVPDDNVNAIGLAA
jgi:hypothetical protein